ncbi:MAG: hypothetical protein RLZZ450_3784 [Pseudomonadota bacterium]|jgi:hypothetical protein
MVKDFVRSLAEAAQLPAVWLSSRERPLDAWTHEERARAESTLQTAGALLLRGFETPSLASFQQFAESFGHALLDYEFASTPRTSLTNGVYTSTEYPAHQRIPLHNEQSYTRSWPMKIWFYCERAAEDGGETPIADSRAIYRAIPTSIRDRFVERGLRYVRNYGGGLDVPWQQVFGTEDTGEVERICDARGIACEWKGDGELRTREHAQAVARHPRTDAWVWFNQAHLFHVSALAADVRESLLEVVDEEDLPRNVYYGDGAPIEDALLAEIRQVLDRHKVVFPWQSGDVLMLDNMLVAHAREPFRGPRQVRVAMAEPYSK